MVADDGFEPSPERLHFEDLAFNYSCLEGDAFKNILRCFPSLKKFYYNHGGAVVGDHDFLPQKIGEAIAQLKPCLEELCYK